MSQQLPDLIDSFRSVEHYRPRVIFLAGSVREAGEFNIQYAMNTLQRLGAVHVDFGTRIWELNGQCFEFISARSGLKPMIQKLNEGNAHVVLLCKPDDFGDEWEYVQQVLQALYSTHRSDVWFPTAKSSLIASE